MEPPQGPVFLSLPMDTLDEEADVDIEPTTYTRWRGRVDPAGMAEVAALLLGAERPMLMVGDGIALADAQPEVVALAEIAGLPVFECYASEFTVPASHPLNQGALNFVTPGPLRATLEGCDLLLVVGAPMFQLIFPEVQSPVPAGTKIVQIDINPWEIGKNVNPDLAFLADPKAALAELVDQVRRKRTPQQARVAAERAEKIGERTKAARARYWEQAKKNWDATPISAPRLMHEIRHALPDDALVFAEAITNSAHLTQALMPDEPGRLVRVRGGGIGPGLPGSLGAQLAQARSQGRGHLLGRRGDVLDLGALDGRPSSDPGHLRHAEQRRLPDPQAQHGRVPRQGRARAGLHRHGPDRSRAALRSDGGVDGRTGLPRGQARRPRPNSEEGARPRRPLAGRRRHGEPGPDPMRG